MFEGPGPHVFALPPGADFPAALVDGVQARMADHRPEAMAQVTIYLNTARMRRAVREVFGARGAAFLPKLRLVIDPGTGPLGGPRPEMTPLRRRLGRWLWAIPRPSATSTAVNSTALNGAWRTQGASTNTGRATSRLLSSTVGHACEGCTGQACGCQARGADRKAGFGDQA
jgi:hypothetical protein